MDGAPAPHPAQALAAELRRRFAADQAARGARDWPAMDRVDAENTAWLKSAVAAGGWPRLADVGREGATHAWLLAQHADADPGFQEEALRLLTAAVAAGEALPEHQALLTDRVRVNAGQPQLYGTQYAGDPDSTRVRPHPIEDPERLDERRAAVGLEPHAVYDRRMRGG
ncbi:DUF6624 domain-containing protein [Streptomyces boncukensis]|uniref:Uncharacterized protein n=1 Tax=Streptomyces boncukensis TaxID=2711219 RepID=A0A6G4X4W0_9ACTN|nr:DUF6624 domain-containing protein [Streptomyces boncukensis]NGO71701.1 hypothetical protein [Streptomyces boncukensis]